jgi:cellulose synthase/poly-beta-1,6-N-acetylglucosamine synthase-like glycosyltransferase
VATDRPSISAVITAHNSVRFIADAVASIRSQRPAPDEIVVVDDGSTDGTDTIVKKLGTDIRYVWQANRGRRQRAIAVLPWRRAMPSAFSMPTMPGRATGSKNFFGPSRTRARKSFAGEHARSARVRGPRRLPLPLPIASKGF